MAMMIMEVDGGQRRRMGRSLALSLSVLSRCRMHLSAAAAVTELRKSTLAVLSDYALLSIGL